MHTTKSRSHVFGRLVASASTLAVVVIGGCGGTEPIGEPRGAESAGEPIVFGHVHGLGVNPSDDRLYVASHMGVFRQTETGFERVADRWQDTMAFTVTGDDTFLASGHPDPRETEKPAHLGLIESIDAAETWTALSLEGESDFHALEPAADRLYGYDSAHGVLKVTRDHRQWRDIARAGVVDLAVDPGDPEALLVTDERARLLRLGPGAKLNPLKDAPRMAYIDWPQRGLLVGVAPNGAVYRSRDGATSWEPVNSVGSAPEALDITPGQWHVATAQGLFSSIDDGTTWIPVVGQSRHH